LVTVKLAVQLLRQDRVLRGGAMSGRRSLIAFDG
jgi:hypothetical protein